MDSADSRIADSLAVDIRSVVADILAADNLLVAEAAYSDCCFPFRYSLNVIKLMQRAPGVQQ